MSQSQACYLLEIGCEEIPARFVPLLAKQLSEAIETLCRSERFEYQTIQWQATYRRIAIKILNLSPYQQDADILFKGPPLSLAKTADGHYTKAAEGFAKKQGCKPADLIEKSFNGRLHCAYQRFEKGQQVTTILAEQLPPLIMKHPLPIAMTWGNATHRFIRPIHWICSLYETVLVPLTLCDIKADCVTYGHRMLSGSKTVVGKKILFQHVNTYEASLETHGHVILNQDKRRQLIVTALRSHGQYHPDESLLEELVYLTENPTVLKAHFSKKFLQLPAVVLVECMRKHQRYFPLLNEEGDVQPACLIVADSVTSENQERIIRGNERVLAARLEDALFFYHDDCSRPLQDYLPELAGLLFQKNAGSMADKQVRLEAILLHFKAIGLTTIAESELKQAAAFSKLDLVSKMVVEFPALQGVMGELYALKHPASAAIAPAIREQYLPSSAQSKRPETELGQLLALADRLDTTVVSFQHGANPTGSHDPLGLRRAVMAICMILFDLNKACCLESCIGFCYHLITQTPSHRDRLMTFVWLRLRTLLVEKGIPQDIASAVLPLAHKHVTRAYTVAQALDTCRNNTPVVLKQIAETAIRISRLSKKALDSTLDMTVFSASEQQVVQEILGVLNPNLKPAEIVDVCSFIAKKMTVYFDSTLIMDPDPALQHNRLLFLKECALFFDAIALFDVIVFS